MRYQTEMTREELCNLARVEGAHIEARRAARLFGNARWMRENKHPAEAARIETEAVATLSSICDHFTT